MDREQLFFSRRRMSAVTMKSGALAMTTNSSLFLFYMSAPDFSIRIFYKRIYL